MQEEERSIVIYITGKRPTTTYISMDGAEVQAKRIMEDKRIRQDLVVSSDVVVEEMRKGIWVKRMKR